MISHREALRASILVSVSLTPGAACSDTFTAAEEAAGGASAGTGGTTADGTGGTTADGTGGTDTGGSGGTTAGGSGGTTADGTGGTTTGGSGGDAGTAGSGGTTTGGTGGTTTGGSGGYAGTAGTGGDSCAYEMCGADCIDLAVDAAHCGACDYGCVGGRTCDGGTCTNTWVVISEFGAPSARIRHSAVWDGSSFHPTGGGIGGVTMGTKTGGRYHPDADSWTPAPELTSERCAHIMVHGPDGTFAYGGLKDCRDGTTTVAALDQLVGTVWQGVNQNNVPEARYSLSALWAFGELFTYGGSSKTVAYTSLAASYDPDDASWADLHCTAAYCARAGRFSAFVDGDVIRVWGGGGPGQSALNYGMVYDPDDDDDWSKWMPLPEGTPAVLDQIADAGDYVYALVPDGTGTNTDNACGGDVRVIVYDKTAGIWRRGPIAPAGMSAAAAVAWSGTEFIAWSGQCGTGASDVGARYQPPADPSTLPALVP